MNLRTTQTPLGRAPIYHLLFLVFVVILRSENSFYPEPRHDVFSLRALFSKSNEPFLRCMIRSLNLTLGKQHNGQIHA